MLDHSIILFGSNMSNSDAHNNDPLPPAVIGRGYGGIKGDQHLHYPQDTPHANLLLTLHAARRAALREARQQLRPVGRSVRSMRHGLSIGLLLVAGGAMAMERTIERPAFVASDADQSAQLEADVNARQPDGSTALHWAVYDGDLAQVKQLLSAGADVAAANAYGATALSLAAVQGDALIINVLLKAGANPNAANAEGQTALMAVARTGNIEAAKLLLKAGANVNAREHWGEQTALMWAAAKHQPQMLQLLLKQWRRTGHAERRPRLGSQGHRRAPGEIHGPRQALRRSTTRRAKAAWRASPRWSRAARTSTSWTARARRHWCIALMNLHFDTAKVLIESGADIQLWDFYGQTPLYAAVDTNTVPRGARPDVPSTDATTGMDIIDMLIERGANVNAQLKLRLPGRAMPGDRNADFRVLNIGATPLTRAAVAADIPAMQALLQAGALVDLPVADGITPFFAAILPATGRARFKTEQQALEAMRVLKAAGADPARAVTAGPRVLHLIHVHTPDHARVPGTTPLMMAAVRGWKDVARELVAYGMDINAKDADGMTALDYAMGRERFGFLQVKPSPNRKWRRCCANWAPPRRRPIHPPWPPLSVPQIRAVVPKLLYF